MKKIITGLFAIAAFTFSVSAQTTNSDGDKRWDKDNQSGDHRGHGDRMGGMQNLNLTDAQKQQMKSINEDFKSRMESLNKNDNITVRDSRTQKEALMQDRKNKISAILTPEQKTQFEQFANRGEGRNRGEFGNREDRMNGDGSNRGDRMSGDRGSKMNEDRFNQMKTDLGLTDEQVAKMKENNESFRQKGQAIRENQSLTEDQKKQQMETLRKEREEGFKSYLTADQIAKLQQMRGNGNWKEKRKDKDGKEKIKTKTT